MKKNAGFTLAEVLITLGIIGVVAAMTIPTLMANINGAKYRNQYKKTLSALNQGVRMNMANNDWNFGDVEGFFGGCSGSENPQNEKSTCALFNGSMKGNWLQNGDRNKFSSSANDRYIYDMITTYNEFYDGCGSSVGGIFQFNDGAMIFACAGNHEAGCTKSHPCYGFIDVNGTTLPNKETRCKNESETNDIRDHEEYDYESSSSTIVSGAPPCIVDNKSIGDVFPVYFYDNTVEPATNAAAYVLNTAK